MLDIERKTACARDRKRGWRRDRAKNMYTFDMPFSIDLCNLSMLSLFHLTFPIELNWINDDDSLNLFQKLSLSLSLFLPPNFHRFFHVYSTTIHIFLDIILLITFKKYCLKQSVNRIELPFTICDRFYLIVAYSSEKNDNDDISILHFPGFQFGLLFAQHISIDQFKWLPTKTIYIIIWTLTVRY